MKQTTTLDTQSHWLCKRATPAVRETEGEFEKDNMAIVKLSLSEAVTWQELLEETRADTELSNLKEAIARGYFTARGKCTLDPQYDPTSTELVVVGGLIV